MPKLPNKSLSFLLGLLGGVVAASMLADKLAIFTNAAQFGQYDPIFRADIGYYMFSLPFIQTLLVFLMEVLLVAIIYTALYYVITLNSFTFGFLLLSLNINIRKNSFDVNRLYTLISMFINITSK